MEMPRKEDPEMRTPAPTLYDTGKMKGSVAKEMESALKGAKFTGPSRKVSTPTCPKTRLGALTNPPTDIEE